MMVVDLEKLKMAHIGLVDAGIDLLSPQSLLAIGRNCYCSLRSASFFIAKLQKRPSSAAFATKRSAVRSHSTAAMVFFRMVCCDWCGETASKFCSGFSEQSRGSIPSGMR